LRSAMGMRFAVHAATPAAETGLRIAQVAPLYESVPPELYGGTERVVSYLTEELVRQGHRVTLFASGDSRTSAELMAVCERAVRLEREPTAAVAMHTLLMEAAFARSDVFDVIHCHIDSIHLPLARRCPVPVITTLHGRLDIAGLATLHREFAELPLVSISDAQRLCLRRAGPEPSITACPSSCTVRIMTREVTSCSSDASPRKRGSTVR
jgi:glycosyltransferase involved in cell wall biosynthesis